MHERYLVSRRRAAMILASTLTAVAAPAAAAVPVREGIVKANTASAASWSDVRELLRTVRRAGSTRARIQAFAQCKVALRSLDAQLANGAPIDSSALYRYPDPTAMLARVIVRELDAMPASDPAWIVRLKDLEDVFRVEA